MAAEGIAFRDAVLAETGGNPFFVGEILRHLTETGVIRGRLGSSGWATSTSAPSACP